MHIIPIHVARTDREQEEATTKRISTKWNDDISIYICTYIHARSRLIYKQSRGSIL